MIHLGREKLVAIIAAHGALTGAVVHAARLMAAQDRRVFAAHLDEHRAELNVAVGELAVSAESFGYWAKVGVRPAVYLPVTSDLPERSPAVQFEADLRRAHEMLKLRRTNLIATLSNSRGILRAAGLPVDHLTAYRRVVRVWAGETVDMVAEVHRLAVADRYLARLTDNQSQRTAAAVLRQWMDELEESDREGELAFAAVCGYADLVERYRSESAS